MVTYPEIKKNSSVPKYIQVANYISKGIKTGSLTDGEHLPSINHLCITLDISKDTATKAYQHLVKKNLVLAVRGKGYYIRPEKQLESAKVKLIFNELNCSHKQVYDSFLEALRGKMDVELYFFNNDFHLFSQYLKANRRVGTHYVLIPPLNKFSPDLVAILKQLPLQQLMVLDHCIKGLGKEHTCIYHDYEHHTYQALLRCLKQLEKYEQIKLIFPKGSGQPRGILRGVQQFCIDFNLPGRIVSSLTENTLERGEVYLTVQDQDLIQLLQQAQQQGLQLGKDIGVLACRDSPFLEVLAGGISVIAPNYRALGQKAAQMILEKKRGFVANDFQLLRRASL